MSEKYLVDSIALWWKSEFYSNVGSGYPQNIQPRSIAIKSILTSIFKTTLTEEISLEINAFE